MVKVRCYHGVTYTGEELKPVLTPSSFVFDLDSLILYLDLNDKRVPVKSPISMDIINAEGVNSGYINIVNEEGTTVSQITREGDFIGNIQHSETTQDKFLVATPEGQIVYRTAQEIWADLAGGSIRIETENVDVVEDSEIQEAQLPKITAAVEGELLSFTFDQGKLPTISSRKVSVVQSINVC